MFLNVVIRADYCWIVDSIVIETLGLLEQVHPRAFVEYCPEIAEGNDGA